MEKIATSTYVDDLISGGYNEEELIELEEISTKMFQEGWFILHKSRTKCSIKS